MHARKLGLGMAVTLSLLVGMAAAQDTVADKPSVRVVMAPGHAKLVVQRTWHNRGDEDGVLSETFHIESGGVLTNLRMQSARGGWMKTQLLPVEQAQAVFDGEGADGGEAGLLTTSLENRFFSLLMHPFLASSSRTIRYTVLLPTIYADGRHVIDNPGFGDEDLTPVVTQVTAAGGGKVLIDTVDAAKVRATGDVDGREIQLEDRQRPMLSGGLAYVDLGTHRRALRYRIHARSTLSEMPRQAHVVLVLDASRSMSTTQSDGMLAAARGYIANIPDAQVDIIAFDRQATSVFGGFVSASQADTVLSTLALERRNGSEVSNALALAGTRLADAPKAAPKRVVLFTDALTRALLEPKDLALGSAGGLVHVAVMDVTTFGLERFDEHPWSPEVEKTGGVMWHAQARPSAELADQRATFEELVRPLRLHHVKLRIPAARELEDEIDSTLAEGAGLSGLALADDTDPRVRLAGVLWAKPVNITLDPSPAETKLWEGMLLGSALRERLTDDEQRRLALKAGVATEHTSFVAATKGKRPSMLTGGTGGFGSSHCIGCRAGVSRVKTTPMEHPETWLRSALTRAYVVCRGTEQVTVKVETTLSEIVDVHVLGASAVLATCLSEATWRLATPVSFSADKRAARFAVTLP